MSATPLFLKNKVSRQIRSSGKEYEFISMLKDGYNQPITGDSVKIVGVWHEQNSFISVQTTSAASVQRKKSPMILTLIDDNMKSIKQGDLIYISGVKYTVSGILDIGNYGVVADISLEMEV